MSPPPQSSRVQAIDLLRGLVMVVMALDHVRDYLMPLGDPVDLATTFPALFFTRFITHYCAPTFYFLAGVSAFLSSRKRSVPEVAHILWTRGLWLVFLELVVVRFGWYFTSNLTYFEGLTIWALGWSMIALSFLIRLPRTAILAVGAAMVLGHNALDWVKPESFGPAAWIWTMLHVPGGISIGPTTIWIAYPLVPWIGVMALGYVFAQGGIPRALQIGPALIAGFLILRGFNIYGDPHAWTPQKNLMFSIMSFLNCQKYPPSLLYLLVTLGPSITIIGLVNRFGKGELPALTRPLVLFGKVPMFYYLIHIYVAHALGVLVAWFRFGDAHTLFEMPVVGSNGNQKLPSNAPLWAVYAVWLVVLLVLYPLCRWYSGVKARHKSPLFSYL